jgi:beta-glucanase (GH16 family)
MIARPLLLLAAAAALLAVDPTVRPLIDLHAPGALPRLVASAPGQTTITQVADGIAVAIAPGASQYPGVAVKPEGAAWDLALSGHVEAALVNTGATRLRVIMRIDNAGDWKVQPWSTSAIDLEPGASGALRVYYGYDSGRKAFALDPARITQALLFIDKSAEPRSFRLTVLESAGPPGEQPPIPDDQLRVVPAHGLIFGAGAAFDAARQVEGGGNAFSVAGGGGGSGPVLTIAFAAGQGERPLRLKPALGRWDLRSWLELTVRLRNAGTTLVQPRLRVTSDSGAGDWALAPAALAPGASAELHVPFASAAVWSGEKNGSGSHFTNSGAGALEIAALPSGDARSLAIELVSATLPARTLPDWLGQRPPVAGAWSQTFSDDFTGTTLDQAKWSVQGPNYWDKAGHFSRDNVIIGDGVVRLRVMRKRGHQDDDPAKPESDLSEGYLHTLDRFAQRYGYFEARMRLPSAPGLWPAFWMMPDRGTLANDRQGTGNGGMEFDILEHLTGWGPNRYNIAMHWDGYGKEHKSTGSDRIYVQPDADGFIVAGLLWEPGRLVYYGNGSEVLRWEDPRVANVPAMLMFTMPVGGWDNTPLDDSRLPADFIIDWVRAWQRKDLAELPPAR